MPFASPDTKYPITLPGGADVHEGTVFLQAAVDHPRMDVGAYTYASAHQPPGDWAFHLAPFLYPNSPEKLIIGKFCQIASGVQFITASANHRYDGFSSYPFAVMDQSFDRKRPSMPDAGPDTCIGHDVWIGTGATVLPGAIVGNGVIVGAGAVVGGRVPDYAIVAGNPAVPKRMRFEPDIVDQLNRIGWWDWPIDHILEHEAAICGADIAALIAAAEELKMKQESS